MRATLTLGLLLAAGLAGCITSDSPGPIDTTLAALPSYAVPAVPKVDAKALLADHAAFVTKNNERAQNLPTHESARVDLLERFSSYGLQTYRQEFTDGIPQANIVGIKWGVDRTHWVVVGGHYDTTTDDCVAASQAGEPTKCPLRGVSQGAYDDGSGTMLTVHLAKAFANVSTYYTIAFVAFDGEERGTQGAKAFVEEFTTGASPFGDIQVIGDIDLDMIGINWPGTMAPINVITNSDSLYNATAAKAEEMGFPEGQIIRKDGLKLGSSDYAQFWRVSDPAPIPTIFLISDFEEVGAPAPAPADAHTPTAPSQLPLLSFGAYPFWHLQDTVETMTAMAGGQAQLEAGFQSAADISAHLTHLLACQPGVQHDAVVHA